MHMNVVRGIAYRAKFTCPKQHLRKHDMPISNSAAWLSQKLSSNNTKYLETSAVSTTALLNIFVTCSDVSVTL